jgi:hypothetical protein
VRGKNPQSLVSMTRREKFAVDSCVTNRSIHTPTLRF